MRLLYIVPIVAVIAAVTAALRTATPGEFARDFGKTFLFLAAVFAGLAAAVVAAGWLL